MRERVHFWLLREDLVWSPSLIVLVMEGLEFMKKDVRNLRKSCSVVSSSRQVRVPDEITSPLGGWMSRPASMSDIRTRRDRPSSWKGSPASTLSEGWGEEGGFEPRALIEPLGGTFIRI